MIDKFINLYQSITFQYKNKYERRRQSYLKSRFKTIEELRDEKIDSIIKSPKNIKKR